MTLLASETPFDGDPPAPCWLDDEAPAGISAAAGSPVAEMPVAIDGLFGWLSPGTSRRGVILCGTHGYEQLSAHRAWRTLAGRIAATGCTVLRFDYPGEGDSADDGAGRVASWVAGIRRAMRHLREEAGVDEVVLVGLRLGATLAALAAREGGVDRLALLAPFATGRAYLREMRMQARTVASLPDSSPLPDEPGYLTVGGFRLGAELVADLSGIDLVTAAEPPAPRILLVGAEAGKLAERYRALGADLTVRPFPGLAVLVANPLFAETPDEAFAAVVDFAAAGAAHRPARPRALAAPARLDGPDWSEEAIRFGTELFGILCRPLTAARGPTVLFVNAGTSAHSGWGRQTTDIARELAGQGIRSLRMDLRGVGDSPDRDDGVWPLYVPEPLEDVRAALDHLARVCPGPVAIVGSCSGAYLAFHALCREPRITLAFVVNLYCFDWDPEQDVETVIRHGFRSAATYASMLKQGSVWRRLLRGEIRVAAIAAALARAGRRTVRRHLANVFRAGRTGGTVAQRIAEVRRRGDRLRLVYSAGDRGLEAVRLHLGKTPAQVAKRLGEPVCLIENADHDLSTGAAQTRMRALLKDFLDTARPA